MLGYIYKTTNLLTGEVYVGQHRASELDTSYFGSGKRLKAALTQYGKENFSVEVLDTANSPEELNEKEREWVELFKQQSNCYNINAGGAQDFERTNTKRSKSIAERWEDQQVRDRNIEALTGRRMSEWGKARMSSAQKLCCGTEERRAKNSEAQKRFCATEQGKAILSAKNKG